MIVTLLKFLVGLSLLLFSTEKFVRLAERVSKVLKISPLIIGITVVAIGTSIPELVVSVISTVKQDTALAMGNIIGSNIVNVLLIFPVGILIGNLKIGRIKTQYTSVFLLGATLVFFVSHTFSTFRAYAGYLLIGLAVLFSFLEYLWGVFGRDHEDVKRYKNTKDGSVNLAQLIIGTFLLLLIIVGGTLVVDSVESISALSGISTSILGLTLTAVATSLPELLTTIYSQNNHQEKITVGNVLGSNVYNLLFVGGILMLFPSDAAITVKEWVWLSATTIGFAVILRGYSGRSPPKWIGLMILLVFFLYIFTQ